MQYPHVLNSKDFCLLVRKLQARLKYEYKRATGDDLNWNFISRVPSHIRGKNLTLKHSVAYFLVRDDLVFKYLIAYYIEAGCSTLKQAVNGQTIDSVSPTEKLYHILASKLSNPLIYNKYSRSKREPNEPVKLKTPYHKIIPLYGRDFDPISLSTSEKTVISSTNLLVFEVLYLSIKNKNIAKFELIFDFDKKTVRVNGFHAPANRPYVLKDFEAVVSGDKSLRLNLKREKTNETLLLNINLGNYSIDECNYFSGTYIGTSFRTNDSISGTIYLLRKDFLNHGEDREACQLELKRRLNLQMPGVGIKVLDRLVFEKNPQQKKSREELLAEHIGVHLACTRRKDKSGEYMEVAIFELKDDFTASFRFPWKKHKPYKCYIELGDALGKQALALRIVFAPPNDPMMLAMVNIPQDDEERDLNILKGRFCTPSESGGLVLHRLDLKDGKFILPQKVYEKTKMDPLYFKIWEILKELNQ